MSVQTMSKDQERSVMGAVEEVIKMANSGVSPDQAVAKVASARAYGSDIVDRMCQAFNTSKTLALIQEADGINKLAVFDVADPDRVRAIMFPSKIETPKEAAARNFVPDEGLQPTTRRLGTKSAGYTIERAEPLERDRSRDLRRAYDVRDKLRGQVKSASMDASSRYREAIDSLQKLANYFRQIPHVDFETVDRVVQGHWGDEGRGLMAAVHALTKQAGFNFKRAQVVRDTFAPMAEPYDMVREALQAREDYHAAQTKAAEAQGSLEHLESEFGKLIEKVADAGDTLANVLLLDRMQEVVGPDDKPMSEHVSRASEDLMDPTYDAQRKGLRAQVMLSDLMATDPVISRHPQQNVLSAYNRLSSSYPHLADSEIALQAYLRRLLEGGEVDPNDLSTATDIESTMSKAPGAAGPGEGARAITANG